MPADDYTDPAVATTFGHLDATTALSRPISELGIYPAVDPLASSSRILDPAIVGEEHYRVARGVQETLQRYSDLQDIIAILGDRRALRRRQGRRRTRAALAAFLLAAVLRRRAVHRDARQVRQARKTRSRAFKEILDGKLDHLPEQAFFYCGAIDEVKTKAEKLGVTV